jgi:mRNA interferase HicA
MLMKRVALIGKIGKASSHQGKDWTLSRQGARHEVWVCGATTVTIPRHRDINEMTAKAIQKQLESELGAAWWK